MKKNLSIFLMICTIFSLLSGCFLYDKDVGNNISPFIDPLNNDGGSFIPETNAEKVIVMGIDDDTPTVAEDEEEEGDGIVILSDNSIRQTKPPIVEIDEENHLHYYYEGEGFRFQIPFLWRNTMEVDILTEIDEETEVKYYTFYYVPSNQFFNPPYRAQVMTLRVAPQSYFQKHGHGTNGYSATGTVSSLDGTVYTYYAPDESQKLSSDFPNIEDYSTIIKVLTNSWNFKHID